MYGYPSSDYSATYMIEILRDMIRICICCLAHSPLMTVVARLADEALSCA